MANAVLVPVRTSARSYAGFSTDGFPANATAGATIVFYDTGETWIFDGTQWVLIDPLWTHYLRQLAAAAETTNQLLVQLNSRMEAIEEALLS